MTDWDFRFLEFAKLVAGWSKDPSTQVGCVIVRRNKTVASMGYNGFPRGVEDTAERLNNRDLKYPMTVHAETNAIINAAEPLELCHLYVWPFPPCSSCAANIIQSGISRVVSPMPTDEQLERWGDSMALAEQMFAEAGVLTQPIFNAS